MFLIYLVIIGAAAGYVATRMMNLRTGPVLTIVIGIVGAVIGGLLLKLFLVFLGLLAALIGAVIGAAVLIGIWQALAGR
ncbi:GlsB/YeaQ/YmgE family stress response membrane protein [Acidimangrovimonas sediminis]|uniref:GlsB/YeaQ/YmgE family stress response membrane protein n=1 Tax=Acidimangrovimonas sediminis TaxID=2056283 RepID=UPI000C7FBFA9|nr:GlsB/YeaQ/YmgE family stress response membrane protein [Acidimangrovimonas sediminis]